jgi:arsenate reductase
MTAIRKKILFLCTGNSCRSQMAEAWTRHLKSDVLEPCSAGVKPGILDTRAVKVMAEAGIDISSHQSKPVNTFKGVEFDYVVTVCGHANETCPFFPGKTRRIHMGFDDPPKLSAGMNEAESLSVYRRVRDEIKAFVEQMPDNLPK